MLRLVPVLRRRVDPVPRELVEDQQRRQAHELVERRPERVDVMQHTACNDGGERARVVELFERDLPVRLAGRRVRINREHVVPGFEQRRRDPAFVPAPDLEHARRRRGQL